ncbi:MAG: hypothetical protein CM15mP83_1140 [Flavobacteriaceae bacterium]|nr:MAG: hypothetical protein CM15mP83_1140 [Flavobacteriaceae bacterium]
MTSPPKRGHNDSFFLLKKQKKGFIMKPDPNESRSENVGDSTPPPILRRTHFSTSFPKESFTMNENRIGSKPFFF